MACTIPYEGEAYHITDEEERKILRMNAEAPHAVGTFMRAMMERKRGERERQRREAERMARRREQIIASPIQAGDRVRRKAGRQTAGTVVSLSLDRRGRVCARVCWHGSFRRFAGGRTDTHSTLLISSLVKANA